MIGKKIKEFRNEVKITSSLLAKNSGITQPYLSQIENEKRFPSVEVFFKLILTLARNGKITVENIHDLDIATFEEWKATQSKEDYENSVELLEKQLFSNEDFVFTDKIYEELLHEKYERLIELYQSSEESDIETAYTKELLFEWWYDHFLEDLYNEFIYIGVEKKVNDYILHPQEKEIMTTILSVRSEGGNYNIYDDSSEINANKEMLEGKKVKIDLSPIFFDKENNYSKKLLLEIDNEPLSPEELSALKFVIQGIRYNRKQ